MAVRPLDPLDLSDAESNGRTKAGAALYDSGLDDAVEIAHRRHAVRFGEIIGRTHFDQA